MNSDFDEAYTYDGLNQLAGFDRNGGDRTIDWDYDALGNFQGVEVDGVTESRTHNEQNEVTSVGANSLTFDANGNMTTDETGRIFKYDAWNRLVEVQDSGHTLLKRYEYDGTGRRISEDDGTHVTDLYYSSGWQVLEETVDGDESARYVWSPVYIDAMVLRDRDSDGNGSLDERLWAIHDANFNILALADGSGTVVERYAYDPYGVVAILNPDYSIRGSGTSYGINYGFQGLRFDAASGLNEARNRWYSPTLGRWVTMDPIWYAAGDNNLYRFASNEPNGKADPSGLRVICHGIGGGLTVAAGGGAQIMYCSDDCGNYGYFLGLSPGFGFAGGIGYEGGVYSGTLSEFKNGFTLGITGNTKGPFSVGGDFGFRKAGDGLRFGIGLGGGVGTVSMNVSGLIRQLPNDFSKECPDEHLKKCPSSDGPVGIAMDRNQSNGRFNTEIVRLRLLFAHEQFSIVTNKLERSGHLTAAQDGRAWQNLLRSEIKTCEHTKCDSPTKLLLEAERKIGDPAFQLWLRE